MAGSLFGLLLVGASTPPPTVHTSPIIKNIVIIITQIQFYIGIDASIYDIEKLTFSPTLTWTMKVQTLIMNVV